jgi:hypothetical protein
MIEPQHILNKASRKMVQNRASFFSIWMLLVQTDGDLQKINTVAYKQDFNQTIVPDVDYQAAQRVLTQKRRCSFNRKLT